MIQVRVKPSYPGIIYNKIISTNVTIFYITFFFANINNNINLTLTEINK